MLTFFRDFFSPPRHLILLVIAAWVGLILAEKRTERYGISKDDLNTITFYGVVAFIIGGRLSFVTQNIPTFLKSPISIISINPDIFDIAGAVATAIIMAMIYGQRRNLSFWNTLDALTPIFATLTIGLGLSHLAAGTAFGKETDLPWGIKLWNAARHPTQIYEILASILTFALLWFKKYSSCSGILFLTFATLTTGSQLFLQAFRGDNTLVFNNLRQEQIIAWGLLVFCFILFESRFRDKSNDHNSAK